MDPLPSVCLGSFQTGFPREPDDAQQLNTSTSTVRDAFDVLGQHSHTVVPSSADFGAMVRLTTPHPEIRLVMVVDDNRTLVGVIPIRKVVMSQYTVAQ